MSIWISQSVDFISVIASSLVSEPFIYIAVLFMLLPICRYLKVLGG